MGIIKYKMDKLIFCQKCNSIPLIKPYSLEHYPSILIKCNCPSQKLMHINEFLSTCLTSLPLDKLQPLSIEKCQCNINNNEYICRSCSVFFCNKCSQYHSNHDYKRLNEIKDIVNIENITTIFEAAKEYNNVFLPDFTKKVITILKNDIKVIENSFQQKYQTNQKLIQLIQILINNYLCANNDEKLIETLNLVNFTEFNNPFQNNIDFIYTDFTIPELKTTQKLIITESINFYNSGEPTFLFSNQIFQVHNYSIFQEDKLACLMCDGYLRIFDLNTQKCELKAKVWSKLLRGYDGSQILEQKNKNYSENVESCEIIDMDQDNEDEENLQYIDNDEPADEYVNITQLPNKLILIYEKPIYA